MKKDSKIHHPLLHNQYPSFIHSALRTWLFRWTYSRVLDRWNKVNRYSLHLASIMFLHIAYLTVEDYLYLLITMLFLFEYSCYLQPTYEISVVPESEIQKCWELHAVIWLFDGCKYICSQWCHNQHWGELKSYSSFLTIPNLFTYIHVYMLKFTSRTCTYASDLIDLDHHFFLEIYHSTYLFSIGL